MIQELAQQFSTELKHFILLVDSRPIQLEQSDILSHYKLCIMSSVDRMVFDFLKKLLLSIVKVVYDDRRRGEELMQLFKIFESTWLNFSFARTYYIYTLKQVFLNKPK